MERQPVPYDHQLSKTLRALTRPGLLLVGTKRTGESNVMTIGWGTVGNIWGEPMFVVLVRPSRFTYEFIEDSKEFTVNVPTPEMTRWVAVCGSKSGRDLDKFGEYAVATSPGLHVQTATIDDCPMVYECRVMHWNDVIPAHLASEAEWSFYRGQDYHRVYFAKILGAYASPDY
jgi:flavin reductase (DIM6/NTAB) family NADH-FMN oxidoreductase RutF